MTRGQRLALLEIIDTPKCWGYGLCCWCKFAAFSGNCEDGDFECEHRIEKIADCDRACEVWGGDSDCWAFRPRYTYNDIVDAYGLIMQGKYPDMKLCTI